MKLRIVRPQPMGLMAHHAGKEYDAERINRGYRLLIKTRFPYQIQIDDSWVSVGHAEVIADPEPHDVYSMPWVIP